MATLSVRTLWQALTMLGYEPGPATETWNNTIKNAAVQWMQDRASGGNPATITPASGMTSREVLVTPGAALSFLRHHAASYYESSDEAGSGTPAPRPRTRPSEDAPLVVAQPFFRSNNPAAWALFLIPIAAGLGYAGWYFTRTTRRSRRG